MDGQGLGWPGCELPIAPACVSAGPIGLVRTGAVTHTPPRASSAYPASSAEPDEHLRRADRYALHICGIAYLSEMLCGLQIPVCGRYQPALRRLCDGPHAPFGQAHHLSPPTHMTDCNCTIKYRGSKPISITLLKWWRGAGRLF
jgi:hypothetical protein